LLKEKTFELHMFLSSRVKYKYNINSLTHPLLAEDGSKDKRY